MSLFKEKTLGTCLQKNAVIKHIPIKPILISNIIPIITFLFFIVHSHYSTFKVYNGSLVVGKTFDTIKKLLRIKKKQNLYLLFNIVYQNRLHVLQVLHRYSFRLHVHVLVYNVILNQFFL